MFFFRYTMKSLLTKLNLVTYDLIEGIGFRFWFQLMEDEKITSISHCQYVLNYLQSLIDGISSNDGEGRIPRDDFDKNFNLVNDNSEVDDQNDVIVIVLVLGIKFWQNTIQNQSIKDLQHCKVIINYLQGFISDIRGKGNLKPEVLLESNIKCEEPVVVKVFNEDETDIYEDNGLANEDYDDLEHDEDFKPLKQIPKENHVKLKILKRKTEEDDSDPYEADEDNKSKRKEIVLNQIERARNRPRKEKLVITSKRESKTEGTKITKYEKNRAKTIVYCDYCDENFPSVYVTSQHVTIAHEEKIEEFDKKYKTFECYKPDCGKLYYTVKALHKHYREVHKENPKDVCKYARYKKNKNKNFEAFCQECNKSFKIETNYEDHMEEHKVGLGIKLFQCDICQKKFHYRIKLWAHLSTKGQSSAGDSNLCFECGEYFVNFCELKLHQQKHKKKLTYKIKKEKAQNEPQVPKKCFYCDLSFPGSRLFKHMYHEHDHGAVFCDVCGKKCWGKKGIEKHLPVHNEGLPFNCEHCGKGFKSRYNVERHIGTVHTSDSEKKFKCAKCGKGFNLQVNLEGHMNMHLGLKPFKCEFCGAAYQNKSNLMAHKRKSCKAIP